MRLRFVDECSFFRAKLYEDAGAGPVRRALATAVPPLVLPALATLPVSSRTNPGASYSPVLQLDSHRPRQLARAAVFLVLPVAVGFPGHVHHVRVGKRGGAHLHATAEAADGEPGRAKRIFEAMMKMKKIDIATLEAAAEAAPAEA